MFFFLCFGNSDNYVDDSVHWDIIPKMFCLLLVALNALHLSRNNV